MDRRQVWRKLFHNWPDKLPRKGVLVTSNAEQTPFQEFLVHEEFLLVQRRAPDTVGARELIVPYGEIIALKMTEVIKPSSYKAAGFAGGAAT